MLSSQLRGQSATMLAWLALTSLLMLGGVDTCKSYTALLIQRHDLSLGMIQYVAQ